MRLTSIILSIKSAGRLAENLWRSALGVTGEGHKLSWWLMIILPILSADCADTVSAQLHAATEWSVVTVSIVPAQRLSESGQLCCRIVVGFCSRVLACFRTLHGIDSW